MPRIPKKPSPRPGGDRPARPSRSKLGAGADPECVAAWSAVRRGRATKAIRAILKKCREKGYGGAPAKEKPEVVATARDTIARRRPGGHRRKLSPVERAALRKELRGRARRTFAAILEADANDISKISKGGVMLKTGERQRGPVLTVAKDLETGRISYGQNQGEPIENLHPLLKRNLDRYLAAGNPPWTRSRGLAGSHSEIHALNQLLWSREAAKKPVKSLGSFALYNIRTQDRARSSASEPIPRCEPCRAVTAGVHALTD